MRTKELSKRIGLACAALLALSLMPTVGAAQEFKDLQSNGNLHLKGEGSFFIDGTPQFIAGKYISPSIFAADAGSSISGQMYVQYQLPQAQNNKQWPIVFVHGCCLSSKSWQTTPDGRMGWDEHFVRQGFDTYLGEQVSRGRSGFNALQYQKVLVGDASPNTNPAILIATDTFAWNVFRWGVHTCTTSPCSDPNNDTPHPDIRFPMNTVGVGAGSTLTFYNQVIPDLNSTLSLASSPTCANGTCTPSNPNTPFNTPIAMAQLANQLGGAILVGHSQSSGFPTMAALSAGSHGVKGIIQLETGCFGNLTQDNVNLLKNIPILVVVGDYTSPNTPASCVTEMNQINGAGGDMSFARLPSLTPNSLYPGSPGPIFGNEHMMMLDNNNLQVADILIGWINQHVKK
jgi:pimeloyl-ACP methyl ester carboxylesterase